MNKSFNINENYGDPRLQETPTSIPKDTSADNGDDYSHDHDTPDDDSPANPPRNTQARNPGFGFVWMVILAFVVWHLYKSWKRS